MAHFKNLSDPLLLIIIIIIIIIVRIKIIVNIHELSRNIPISFSFSTFIGRLSNGIRRRRTFILGYMATQIFHMRLYHCLLGSYVRLAFLWLVGVLGAGNPSPQETPVS